MNWLTLKYENTAENLLIHLACAFGGHSQYTPKEAGRALAGRIRSTHSSEVTPEHVAQEIYENWIDSDPDGYERILAEVLEGFNS